jgi:hypothetical protein
LICGPSVNVGARFASAICLANSDRVINRQRPMGKPPGQIVTLDQFHDERVVFQSVDLRDVRMNEQQNRRHSRPAPSAN